VLLLLLSSTGDYEALATFRCNVRRVMLPGMNKRKVKVLREREQTTKRNINHLFLRQ